MTERDVLLPICDGCGTVEFDAVAGRCPCGGVVPTHVAAVGISFAEIKALRRERDEARAEAARYREALERIAAFHHAPGTYKAAWVESVRIAREALGGGDD